jgi:hypothetical protein
MTLRFDAGGPQRPQQVIQAPKQMLGAHEFERALLVLDHETEPGAIGRAIAATVVVRMVNDDLKHRRYLPFMQTQDVRPQPPAARGVRTTKNDETASPGTTGGFAAAALVSPASFQARVWGWEPEGGPQGFGEPSA